MSGPDRRMRRFFEEVKRRKVVRVAVVYVVAAVATVEAAGNFFPRLGLQDWTVDLVVGLTVVGLPLALVLAWAYEVTPTGIERQEALDDSVDDGPTTETDTTRTLPTQPEQDEGASAVGSADPRSVAVLPFSNLSPGPEHAYFADGMTEDVLAHLGKVKALRVTSRTSVLRYRDTTKSVREIAGELGVAAVLEGSIRTTADRVRIVAQLIDADTDTHLWADSYDRELEDIFAVQSEVAESVARALTVELSGEELAEINEPPTKDVEAYSLSLEAEVISAGDDPDGYARALGLLEAAVRIDPTYARAYAGLASLLVAYPFVTFRLPTDYHERLKEAVDRALNLDPGSGPAWVARGYYLWSMERDWLGAEAALERALEVEPGDGFVLERCTLHAYTLGRFGHAKSLIGRMEERGVLTPRAEVWRAMIPAFQAVYGDDRLEPSLRLFDDLIAREPRLPLAHAHRGLVLSWAGRQEDALAAVDAALRLAPEVPHFRGLRGAFLAHAGHVEEALVEDAWFGRAVADGTVDLTCQAYIHFALSDIQRGFDLVEEAAASRTSLMLPYFRLVPAYEPLWDHPRFLALMNEIWPGEQKRVLGEYGWRPAAPRGKKAPSDHAEEEVRHV